LCSTDRLILKEKRKNKKLIFLFCLRAKYKTRMASTIDSSIDFTTVRKSSVGRGDDEIEFNPENTVKLNRVSGRTSEIDVDMEKKEQEVMKQVLDELIMDHKKFMKEKVEEAARELVSRHQKILETKKLDLVEPKEDTKSNTVEQLDLKDILEEQKEIDELFSKKIDEEKEKNTSTSSEEEVEEEKNTSSEEEVEDNESSTQQTKSAEMENLLSSSSPKEELEDNEVTFMLTNEGESSVLMNIYMNGDTKYVSFNEVEIPYDDLMKCLKTLLPSEQQALYETDSEEDDSSQTDQLEGRTRSSSLSLKIVKEEDEGEDTVFFEFDLLNTQVMLFLGILIGAVGVWLGYYTMGILKLQK
jgi:hypothetical protein